HEGGIDRRAAVEPDRDRPASPALAVQHRELAVALGEGVALAPRARGAQIELAPGPAHRAAATQRPRLERAGGRPGRIRALAPPPPEAATRDPPAGAARLGERPARGEPLEAQRADAFDRVEPALPRRACELELGHRTGSLSDRIRVTRAPGRT